MTRPAKRVPAGGAYAAVDVPYAAALSTYFGYAVLIVFGYVRDFFGRTLLRRRAGDGATRAPLLFDFDDFYTRRLYSRIADCWGRPIGGPAGAWIDLLPANTKGVEGGDDRDSGDCCSMYGGEGDSDTCRKENIGSNGEESRNDVTDAPQMKHRRVLNLGSYNYLGFGEVPGGVASCVTDALTHYGVSTCGSSGNEGTAAVVAELEATVADFIGKPAALVCGMGFATNAQLLPAIVGARDLLVSDALNHASIVVGARSSAAQIRLFEHNDTVSLTKVLRAAIAAGDPRRDGAPWERVFVVVEGMYSMEGESPPLREIVRIKNMYGAYLFVDEAHSVGAMGSTGRGVCEHYGVDPADVDILMGTFTKSFGAVGGYVASSSALVSQIRAHSAGVLYSSAMSPPCARHIIWALRQIAGSDGTDTGARKITALRDNAVFFRRELTKMCVQTLGDWDSPVIPIMLYNPAKIAAFSRECLARGLAVVVVGFPATPLLLSRARICLSAAHTREDLVWALEVIDEVAELIQIKYDRPLLDAALPGCISELLPRQKSADCLSRFAGHENCADVCLMRA